MTVSCIVIRGVCFDIMSFPPVGNPCIVRTLCLFTHTTTGPVWTPVVLSPCKLCGNYSHILWSGGIDSVLTKQQIQWLLSTHPPPVVKFQASKETTHCMKAKKFEWRCLLMSQMKRKVSIRHLVVVVQAQHRNRCQPLTVLGCIPGTPVK